MKKTYIFILQILIILILVSCKTTKEVTPPEIDSSINNSDGSENEINENIQPLAPIINKKQEEKKVIKYDGQWYLTDFFINEEIIPIVQDTEPNIIGINLISSDKENYSISGFSGVNLYFDVVATIKYKEDSYERDFYISTLTSTVRTGPEEHMLFEEKFKKCLFYSDKIKLTEDETTLVISGENKKSELIFNKYTND